MGDLDLVNLLGVLAIAVAAPLLLALAPRLTIPAVVLELGAGIAAGPHVLGVLEVDEPVAVLAVLGLAMLLFLAGLEVEPHALRGPLLRTAAGGFALSMALAVAVAAALRAAGLVEDVLLVAIVLGATSLGVVVPVLKDAGLADRPFGQLVIAGASIADVATVVLLTLLFGAEGTSPAARLLLLGALLALAVAIVLAVRLAGRSMRLGGAVARLEGTTAELRVRTALLLLVAFAAVAQAAGLEVILGAFVAGLLLGVLDPDGAMRHPLLRTKLQAVGFGLLIPVFFVASGLRFDLEALADDPAAAPVFLVALLVVRGAPAALGRRLASPWPAAALLQATSLPFIVASTAIGVEAGAISPGTAAGLVAAGLASVVLFPALAVSLLRRNAGAPGRTAAP